MSYSPNLTLFLEKLRIIADGDFIPYDWRIAVIRIVFSKKYIEFNSERRLIHVGGILFFAAMTFIIAFAILGLLINQRIFKCRSQFVMKAKQNIFWNSFIRLSLEAYLEVALLVFMDLKSLKSESYLAF